MVIPILHQQEPLPGMAIANSILHLICKPGLTAVANSLMSGFVFMIPRAVVFALLIQVMLLLVLLQVQIHYIRISNVVILNM